jgi:tryptophan 2,3-dioxygenase
MEMVMNQAASAPSSLERPSPAIDPWRAMARSLPSWHRTIAETNDREELAAALAALPELPPDSLVGLRHEQARLIALDVLLIEGFVRHQQPVLEQVAQARLERAAGAVAERLGMKPILSYPLYIRHNPQSAQGLRSYTDLPAEHRFIRMHRFIEDRLDEVIDGLQWIVDSTAPAAAFVEIFDPLASALRRINRVMAGFRSPVRMPNADFMFGFRPYYDPVLDPESGDVLLDGPSGLQSPTFRIVATLCGYEDPILDGWTRRIGTYHEPVVREQLENALLARDAGRSLRDALSGSLGVANDLPHLHPSYRTHIPLLLEIARAGRFITAGVEEVARDAGLDLGHWPAEAPASEEVSVSEAWRAVSRAVAEDPAKREAVIPYLVLEAMLFGFHLEHVATAIAHIGHERGTGGTSGVEFLQMALFRRAFPGLWVTDLAASMRPEIMAAAATAGVSVD